MKKYIIIIGIIIAILTTIFVLNIQNIKKTQENILEQEMFSKKEILENTLSDSKNANVIEYSNENKIENTMGNATTIKSDEIENSTENQIDKSNEITKDTIKEIKEPEIEYIEGIEVIGYIKIPKYSIDAPIFRNVSQKSLNISVAVAYGTLNEDGNTTIYGHAYKNYPFENVPYLESGDKIIITDATKNEITYEVYNKQVINSNDASYMIRNTNGTKEITLQTGDTETTRLIVSAREVN